jgi:hypothetical protein
MKAEYVRKWLTDAQESSKDGNARWWNKYVELITHIFQTGNLPQEVPWSLLVLLPRPWYGPS